MKDPLERTKVVLRHLPPSLTEPALLEQINGKFTGRYKWFCFRPGKNSQKNQRYARAYINFKSPEDVFEFAEFFDGHVFVNEKGTQFKVLVEYAPSQSVPKILTKKDGREGTISKDPEYLEYLELLAKPSENLPSAEIQLERREAERAGTAKDAPVVTPLMDFVRQRRAAKIGSQRTSGSGKPSKRAAITGSSSTLKRTSDKRRGPTLMYVSRDISKNENVKEKQTYILVPRKDDRLMEKSTDLPNAKNKEGTQDETGTDTNGTVSGVPVAVETGKKALLLLKGKEREGSHIHRLEAPGRIIRSILSSKEGRRMSPSQSDVQLITGNTEKDKYPPRPPVSHPNLKEHASVSPHTSVAYADGKPYIDDKAASSESHSSVSISDNKHEKRLRNKDRPDRGVWAPLRRSDGSHGRASNLSSTSEMPVGNVEVKHDTPSGYRSSESKSLGSGRGHHASLDNGLHRHVGRHGQAHGSKELDGSVNTVEGKPSKRGSAGYFPHERQVWVQKSGSSS